LPLHTMSKNSIRHVILNAVNGPATLLCHFASQDYTSPIGQVTKDVYGKRQKRNFYRPSSAVLYSIVKIFVFAVNRKRRVNKETGD